MNAEHDRFISLAEARLLDLLGNPLQRRLERMSATNVVNEPQGEVVSLGGRLGVNSNPEAFPMKRKRVQPRGCRPCPDCGERTISANADRCAGCEAKR